MASLILPCFRSVWADEYNIFTLADKLFGNGIFVKAFWVIESSYNDASIFLFVSPYTPATETIGATNTTKNNNNFFNMFIIVHE